MAKINISRTHHLTLAEARKITERWRQGGERDYGLDCHREQFDDKEVIRFNRSGVSGTLTTTSTEFVLDAKLGFLFSAFKERIERDIHENLDQLLTDT